MEAWTAGREGAMACAYRVIGRKGAGCEDAADTAGSKFFAAFLIAFCACPSSPGADFSFK